MKAVNFLMLSFVVFLWGSSFALIKLGLEEIPPITMAFIRFLLVLPLFVVFTYFQNRREFTNFIFEDWKNFAILGLTGITLYHALQNIGLKFTTASNSSLIIAANPVFIALLDRLYLKERLNVKQILGIILAFMGIIIVISHQGLLRLTFNLGSAFGDVLSLGAGLCWALYSVLGKKTLSSYGASQVTTFSMLLGTLFLFPLIFVFERPVLPTSTWLWLLLFILSFLCSGLGYLVWYRALEDLSPSKAGVFIFFIPVFSVLTSHLILLEPLDLLFGVGAVLVILGTAITERG